MKYVTNNMTVAIMYHLTILTLPDRKKYAPTKKTAVEPASNAIHVIIHLRANFLFASTAPNLRRPSNALESTVSDDVAPAQATWSDRTTGSMAA